jgi:hypothetical protein
VIKIASISFDVDSDELQFFLGGFSGDAGINKMRVFSVPRKIEFPLEPEANGQNPLMR